MGSSFSTGTIYLHGSCSQNKSLSMVYKMVEPRLMCTGMLVESTSVQIFDVLSRGYNVSAVQRTLFMTMGVLQNIFP